MTVCLSYFRTLFSYLVPAVILLGIGPAVAAQAQESAAASTPYILYSNIDAVNDLIMFNGKLWSATDGGVVSWNLSDKWPRRYSIHDGLPSSSANALEICTINGEPTLFAGTHDGLAIYDIANDRWTDSRAVIKTEYSVEHLICDDANGRLIMDHLDLTLVNLDDGSAIEVDDDELAWIGIADITLADDTLWIASGFKGVNMYTPSGILLLNEESGTLSDDGVKAVAIAPDGSAWLGGTEGLIHHDGKTELNVYTSETVEEFFASFIWALTFDADGNLWIGLSGKICQFDPETSSCAKLYEHRKTEGMPKGLVKSLTVIPSGEIFYATDNGIGYFDGSEWATLGQDKAIPFASNTINDMGQDPNGNLWVLADPVVVIGNDGFSTRLDEPTYGSHMAVDANGVTWLLRGSTLLRIHEQGILEFTDDEGLLTSYATLAVDRLGHVWLTGSKGISHIDATAIDDIQITNLEVEIDLPEGFNGLSLLASEEGMWVGSRDGLYLFTEEGHERLLDDEVLGYGDNIFAIAELDDVLYLGTNRGLVAYQGDASFIAEVEIYVQDIAVTSNGHLWVVGSGSGEAAAAYHYDGSGWEPIGLAKGLPSKELNAVAVDEVNGRVYFGGQGGLTVISLDGQPLASVADASEPKLATTDSTNSVPSTTEVPTRERVDSGTTEVDSQARSTARGARVKRESPSAASQSSSVDDRMTEQSTTESVSTEQSATESVSTESVTTESASTESVSTESASTESAKPSSSDSGQVAAEESITVDRVDPESEVAEISESGSEEAVPTEAISAESESVEPAPDEVATGESSPFDLSNGPLLFADIDAITGLMAFDGSVWSTSDNGISRWDPASGIAQLYSMRDGLPNSYIETLSTCVIDGTLTLLAGTQSGLAIYNIADDHWVDGDLIFETTRTVSGIICDEENNRLIINQGDFAFVDLASGNVTEVESNVYNKLGLALLDGIVYATTGYDGIEMAMIDGISLLDQSNGGLSSDETQGIEVAPDGTLWIATRSGIIQHDGTVEMASYTEENVPDFADKEFSHILFDKEGKLWLVARGTLCQFEPASSECAQLFDFGQELRLGYITVTGFAELDGHLFIGIENKGLAHFDGSTWQRMTQAGFMPRVSNSVTDIDLDADGNIWMLSNGGHMTRIKADGTVNIFDGNYVSKQMEVAPNGDSWLLQGDALIRLGDVFPEEIGEDFGIDTWSLDAIAVDDNGAVWAGGEDIVYQWDGSTLAQISSSDGLPEDFDAQTLLPDGSVMWVGSYDGLYRIEGGNVEHLLDEEVLGYGDSIRALAKTDEHLYLGTNQGLVIYDGETVAVVEEVTESVTDITITSAGHIWVTTFDNYDGGGAFHFDGETWQNYTSKEGMPSTSLSTVFVDEAAGIVYIGGTGGVAVMQVP